MADYCFAHRCPVTVCLAAKRGCQAQAQHPSSLPARSPEVFAFEDPIEMLRALVEDTACSYDHDGECQVHHTELRPNVCANGAAREYLISHQLMGVRS